MYREPRGDREGISEIGLFASGCVPPRCGTTKGGTTVPSTVAIGFADVSGPAEITDAVTVAGGAVGDAVTASGAMGLESLRWRLALVPKDFAAVPLTREEVETADAETAVAVAAVAVAVAPA
eukprot:CAMPEP_0197536400 /NCGR_PEP_ID=MMETSP1318-20131121/53775_1 /TAXON_ID=552666 /ORGANISM="Partenskyella glossopodia, Strain RCC365" /LENGTH=121 /DNA_ID=CAMNT_0043094277 /DNA_START=1284 /DNA_END=1645 /DNA_ORIENTATION=-